MLQNIKCDFIFKILKSSVQFVLSFKGINKIIVYRYSC